MSPRNPLTEPLFDSADPGLLLPAVRTFVLHERLFDPGAHILVALSGGPDSVALLHALFRMTPEWGLRLGVAHFDHRLRGEESREDALFAADLARDLNLPFYAGEGDVRGWARAKKISLQMAARQLRLDFLEKVRRHHHYDVVALGHTADDQVELFFLRLLRGAGAEGVKGMWPRTACLVRPLLVVGKDAVLAWLKQEHIPYREDPSNLSRRYLRNRVRLDLVPRLQQEYNPRVKTAVWRLMAFLQEDERLLAETAEQAWQVAGRWVTPDCAALDISRLAAFSPALRMRLLRRTLGAFLSHQEVTSAQVRNLWGLARGNKSGGLIAFGTCQVARAGGELHFFSPLPPPPGPHINQLPGLGAMEFKEGWRLEARKLPGPGPGRRPDSPHLAWLNYDQVSFPLNLRNVLPGDRFWPEGAHCAKKMQDLLVDAKIPRWLRPHLAVVADGQRIIWVPGLGLAEPVKPTPESARIVELAIFPASAYAARIWELLLAWCRKTTTRA